MGYLCLCVLVFLCSIVNGGFPPISQELIDIIAAKNESVPLAGPSQVHVSYAGKYEFVVQWVTSSPNDPSVVNYGLTPTALTFSANGSAVSYSFEGYTSGGIHNVLLPALNVSTTYYYQVGAPGQWSSTYSFKSAPAVGTQNINFGVIADVGSDPNSEQTFKGLLNLRQSEGIDLVIHSGDLSYANNYRPGGPVWDHYGTIIEPVAAYTPYNPAVGNHETLDSFTGFRIRYDTSALQDNSGGGEFYYSFDWGNAHIVMLSSENDYSLTSPQRKWLAADLASVNRKLTPWIIALWHRPWYCSNEAHQGEGEKMRLSIESLFNQFSVDLALTGHVHAYERVAEMYNFVVTPGKTAYVTVGNGGTPEGLASVWMDQPVWSQYRIAQWGFSRLNLVNATHAHWTMFSDADGHIYDDYWFVKSFPRH